MKPFGEMFVQQNFEHMQFGCRQKRKRETAFGAGDEDDDKSMDSDCISPVKKSSQSIHHGAAVTPLCSPMKQMETPAVHSQEYEYGCPRQLAMKWAHQQALSAVCPGPTPLNAGDLRKMVEEAQSTRSPLAQSLPMMMDGETYSVLDEVEVGICDMEADCTPDPSQYQTGLEFCSSSCSGGQLKPDSSIDCSCRQFDRPDQPYCSDYY